MTSVALIALEQCYLSSLSGFMDILNIANAHGGKQLRESYKPFKFSILSASGDQVSTAGGLPIAVNGSLDTQSHFDIVYIPGLFYGGRTAFAKLLNSNKNSVDWLKDQWKKGALIAANCTGTFLLAETGMLDGRVATTTWWVEKQFKHRYPKVKLDIKQLITEEKNLVCAGAITSYQHLALRMIQKFSSQSLASLCAKSLLLDINQIAQAPYITMPLKSDHNDKLIAKAQYLLQQRLGKDTNIEDLAGELAVSHRTLIRKFQKVLGISPLQYLQDLRIETAKQLLENSNQHIDSVISQVGYKDTSSFTRLFVQRTGMTPSAFRKKFKLYS